MAETATRSTAVEPLLKLDCLSHGTVECHDLERARRFYTEVLGFEVVQTSAISLMLRHHTDTIIACVQTRGETSAGIYSHFGLDVDSREKVDEAHALVSKHRNEYGIQKITRPVDQHGTYSFYIVDADGNWWEILENPKGGYNYVFDLEERDAKWRDQNQGRGRRSEWERERKTR